MLVFLIEKKEEAPRPDPPPLDPPPIDRLEFPWWHRGALTPESGCNFSRYRRAYRRISSRLVHRRPTLSFIDESRYCSGLLLGPDDVWVRLGRDYVGLLLEIRNGRRGEPRANQQMPTMTEPILNKEPESNGMPGLASSLEILRKWDPGRGTDPRMIIYWNPVKTISRDILTNAESPWFLE